MPSIYNPSGSAVIEITLTQEDWKLQWSEFIAAVKQISEWGYDGDRKVWTVPNTNANFTQVVELINCFLKTHNPREFEGGLFV